MRAKTKTVLKGFDYMHCDDFAKYLSDMAAKGWHFKEWAVGLKFEKGEPEQVIYAVEVFTKASENDMRPEPHTQEFAEYCEAAGWKFIDAKQKFCIFKKIDMQATELFTPEERVNNAFKGMFSGSSIALVVLSGVNALLHWLNLTSFFAQNIFSGSTTFGILIWSIMFFYQFTTLIHAFLKKRKLKKEIQIGKQIYIGNSWDGKYHFNLKDAYAVALILSLMYYFYIMDRIELIILNVGIIVVTIGFSVILNKIRPERDTNVIIQVVFSIGLMMSIFLFTFIIFIEDDDRAFKKGAIPLVITDYRECEDVIEDTSHYGDGNFLGSVDTYFVFYKENSISYDVYKSKYTKLLDKLWKEEFEGKRFNDEAVDCTLDWDAEAAVRNRVGMYYVRYENAILVFSDDEDVHLTTEQINIIREKLNLR